MTRKQTWDELLDPGDYMMLDSRVVICCPICGSVATTAPNHRVMSIEPLYIEPSLICPEKGCHYYIKDGEIKEIK